MATRGYTLLGWAVWRIGKWAVRRKVSSMGTRPKVLAAVVVTGIVLTAVVRFGRSSPEV